MPRHQEAKKGVISCDKLRGAAHTRRSADARMGKPTSTHIDVAVTEYIGDERPTRGIEPSQYPEEKKSSRDSVSSGERTRTSPNLPVNSGRGCRTAHMGVRKFFRR